jgi:hypothetical protein
VILGGLVVLSLLTLAAWRAAAAIAADFEGGTHGADSWFIVSAPLLWVWSHDANCPYRRREYAVQSLYRCSTVAAQRWLRQQLETNPARSFIAPEQWTQLGIRGEAELRPLVRLALDHLNYEWLDDQFDGDFLMQVAQIPAYRPAVVEELFAAVEGSDRIRARRLCQIFHYDLFSLQVSDSDRQRFDRALRVWPGIDRFWESEELLWDPSKAQTRQQRLQLLRQLRNPGPDMRQTCRPLVEQAWRHDDTRVMAATVFLEWGDNRDVAFLRRVCDGDGSALSDIQDPYLLYNLYSHFPRSRFAQACNEYAAIRGKPYFDLESNSDEDSGRPHALSPAQEEARWRSWLQAWPHHPAADDAAYWVGRCLEWQGRRFEALTWYADLLVDVPGDQDMRDLIWQRFLAMLDAVATDEEVRRFVQTQPQHPMASAVRYALAVRCARQQHFSEALRWSEAGLNGLTLGLARRSASVDAMVSKLDDQRRRWSQLVPFENLSSADNRLRLAQNWGTTSGWKLGYLNLYGGGRAYALCYDKISADAARCPWVRQGYQHSCAPAIAIRLLQSCAAAWPAGDIRRAQALSLEAEQIDHLDGYPEEELRAMLPLPGLSEFPATDVDAWLTHQREVLVGEAGPVRRGVADIVLGHPWFGWP